jgi:transposase
MDPTKVLPLTKALKETIKNLEKEITSIEEEIQKIVQADNELKSNYQLITTIKGIGPVIASNLIIKTENFKRITTAKKAAAFAGVCPYPNSSGKTTMREGFMPSLFR